MAVVSCCLYFVHSLALVLIKEATTINSGLFLHFSCLSRQLTAKMYLHQPSWTHVALIDLRNSLRNYTCLAQHKQMCGVADRYTEGPNDKLMTEMRNHRSRMNRASSIRQISSQQVRGYRLTFISAQLGL